MSTYAILSRHCLLKPPAVLLASNISGGSYFAVLFPTNVIKTSKLLTQCQASMQSADRLVNFSTGCRTNAIKPESSGENNKDEKESTPFTKYQQVATAEDTHFKIRQTQAEKPEASLTVTDQNTQGIIFHYNLGFLGIRKCF